MVIRRITEDEVENMDQAADDVRELLVAANRTADEEFLRIYDMEQMVDDIKLRATTRAVVEEHQEANGDRVLTNFLLASLTVATETRKLRDSALPIPPSMFVVGVSSADRARKKKSSRHRGQRKAGPKAPAAAVGARLRLAHEEMVAAHTRDACMRSSESRPRDSAVVAYLTAGCHSHGRWRSNRGCRVAIQGRSKPSSDWSPPSWSPERTPPRLSSARSPETMTVA